MRLSPCQKQLSDLAAQIRVPTFLTYTKGDEVVDARGLSAFASGLKTRTLIEIEDIAFTHMSMLENIPLTSRENLFTEMINFAFTSPH